MRSQQACAIADCPKSSSSAYNRYFQKHLRWTMDGPDSSYSDLAIHICWKVDSDARMEPPIQTLYLRSGGATTLTFMELGARAVISLFIRSAMPGNMVVPADVTHAACKNSD